MRNTDDRMFSNLNEISFYFFIVIGLFHMLSGLLYVNEIYVKSAWLLNRLLDIPFFIVSFLYIASFFKLKMLKRGNHSHTFETISVIIGGILLLILLTFDLTLKNNMPT